MTDFLELMSLSQRSPAAERAIQRRAQWNAERTARIWKQVADGLLTEDEAKDRLED